MPSKKQRPSYWERSLLTAASHAGREIISKGARVTNDEILRISQQRIRLEDVWKAKTANTARDFLENDGKEGKTIFSILHNTYYPTCSYASNGRKKRPRRQDRSLHRNIERNGCAGRPTINRKLRLQITRKPPNDARAKSSAVRPIDIFGNSTPVITNP